MDINHFEIDEPLSDVEVATCVAEIADKILALTEDPGEHEQIVNELGDVLAGWNSSFPLIPHPLKRVVEEIFSTQKNHVAQTRNGGNGREREQNGGGR